LVAALGQIRECLTVTMPAAALPSMSASSRALAAPSPTLNIEGRHVTVDDSFLKLSPADQQATVDDIASSLSQRSDPVTSNDVVRSAATGVPILGGLLNKADAATNAFAAPLLNPLFDPKDQLQGDTFSDRYAKSLAMQEGQDARFAQQHPVVDTAAKIAGGTAAMVPAVAAAPGLFGVTGGLGSMIGRGAISNAVLGGADSAIRGQDPLMGAGIGGAVGAGAPIAAKIVSGLASPFISNLRAIANPEGYARTQVARAISESGQTPEEIAQGLRQAHEEGQGVYTIADQLGNPGQRLASTVARAPGEGRTQLTDFLEGRQGMQGRRVSGALAEGFGAPETAAQTEARLTGARTTAADEAYSAVRNDAGQVNLVGTIDHIDNVIGTQPGQHLQTPNDSVESVLRGFRERLARVNPDDFEAVQRIRGDMADTAQNAMQSGHGNRARLIRGAVRQLDTAMEEASPGHRAANANFAQASRDIEAVQSGRDAFTRGRSEDVIPAYQSLRPEAQQAFRSGYVDPAIAQTQGAAFGVNKARPFLNDAFGAEAEAMAPGNAMMQRRLGREQTMFETRNHALGGSRTADNLNDHAAMAIDPTVVAHLLAGHYGGAVRQLIHAGSRVAGGNTPAVRAEIAQVLLTRGPIAPDQLNRLVGEAVQRLEFAQALARTATRAASGAVAVEPATNKRPKIFAPTRKAS
jgi:hypothetical protein